MLAEYDQNHFISINQTYKIWKKHSPFLYNLIQTYPLTTCSQTVDWFTQHYVENDWKIYNLVIGTNSLAQNAVVVLNVGVPTGDALTDFGYYRDDAPEQELAANGYIGTMGVQTVTPKITIPQASQVMRATINCKDQNLIAVKTGGINPELLVYDIRNKQEDLQQNVVKLVGHQSQGFGLAWNSFNNGKLLSGSDDKKIFLYDLNQINSQNLSWTASEGVEDVKWSNFNDSLFATAQQDGKICIWDIRSDEKEPILTRKAHEGETYSLDFNKKSPHLLISGGEDGDIALWDIRNLSKKIHTFVGHNQSVNCVAWNPQNSMQFASGSNDRKIVYWDIERLNKNTKQKTGQQILFIHSGHKTKVTDLSWGPQKQLMASTEESNTLQVWRMNQRMSQQRTSQL